MTAVDYRQQAADELGERIERMLTPQARAKYRAGVKKARELLDLAALDRLDFDVPCENPHHAAGDHSCVPSLPAAYVWRRIAHPCDTRGEFVLLCAGVTSWLTAHPALRMKCTGCGEWRTLQAVIELVGPLSQVSGTLTP